MPATTEISPDEQDALRAQCTRFLHGHGPIRPAELLAAIPADTVPDRYGDGGVVAELEAEVAALLGKPAAVFVPSGTMAQQAVLRVHADRRQRRTIVFHPMCHLDTPREPGLPAAARPDRPPGGLPAPAADAGRPRPRSPSGPPRCSSSCRSVTSAASSPTGPT